MEPVITHPLKAVPSRDPSMEAGAVTKGFGSPTPKEIEDGNHLRHGEGANVLPDLYSCPQGWLTVELSPERRDLFFAEVVYFHQHGRVKHL